MAGYLNIEKTAFIIFDRDGTLIEYVPYLKDSSKIKILRNTFNGINLLKNSASVLVLSQINLLLAEDLQQQKKLI